ncbi:hypothetical protein GCM10009677_64210 [Sphaerisporangium rubeum]
MQRARSRPGSGATAHSEVRDLVETEGVGPGGVEIEGVGPGGVEIEGVGRGGVEIETVEIEAVETGGVDSGGVGTGGSETEGSETRGVETGSAESGDVRTGGSAYCGGVTHGGGGSGDVEPPGGEGSACGRGVPSAECDVRVREITGDGGSLSGERSVREKAAGSDAFSVGDGVA